MSYLFTALCNAILGIAHLTVQRQEIKPTVEFILFYITGRQYNYTAALRRNPSMPKNP